MNAFDEYQSLSARTINRALTDEQRLLDAAAGLAEEAGEVLGIVRKHLLQGRALDRSELVLELGDALWCLAAVAREVGVPLSEVAVANRAKLAARFPDS